MRILTIVTIYGELIGRVPDALTDAAILEQDQPYIVLERPIRLVNVPVPTPNGLQMINTMIPAAQTLSIDELPVQRMHIVAFGDTDEAAARQYMKMTSGIELPPSGGGGLNLVKG